MTEPDIVTSRDGAIVETNTGFILPTGRRRVSAADIVDQLRDVLSTDYTGSDPNKLHLTKGQAAFMTLAEHAQDGDIGALNVILDRFIGRPTQQVNTLNVSASLTEFLGALAEEIENPQEPIDVTPVPPLEPQPWD